MCSPSGIASGRVCPKNAIIKAVGPNVRERPMCLLPASRVRRPSGVAHGILRYCNHRKRGVSLDSPHLRAHRMGHPETRCWPESGTRQHRQNPSRAGGRTARKVPLELVQQDTGKGQNLPGRAIREAPARSGVGKSITWLTTKKAVALLSILFVLLLLVVRADGQRPGMTQLGVPP